MIIIKLIIGVVVVFSFIASTGFITAVFAVSNDDDEANIMRSFINDNNPNNAGSIPHRAPNLIRTMEVTAHGSAPPNGQGSATATCPTGWVATGGGFSGSGAPGVFFTASQPGGGDPPNSWFVVAFNTNPGPNSEAVNAQVICARAP
jgi:hypothetical protein